MAYKTTLNGWDYYFYVQFLHIIQEFIDIHTGTAQERHALTIIIYLDCFIDCVTGHELVERSHINSGMQFFTVILRPCQHSGKTQITACEREKE
jgi:hypothetical protein